MLKMDKKTLFALVLGASSLAFFSVLWIQVRGTQNEPGETLSDKEKIDGEAALLEELSGNAGYDGWSEERKLEFEKEQLLILDGLQSRSVKNN